MSSAEAFEVDLEEYVALLYGIKGNRVSEVGYTIFSWKVSRLSGLHILRSNFITRKSAQKLKVVLTQEILLSMDGQNH